MASINFNFNWFGENWFQKPPKPISPLNLISPFTQSNLSHSSPNFCSISSSTSNLFNKFKKPKQPKPEPEPEEDPYFEQLLEQYKWECQNLPDYRHTPEVDKIIDSDEITIKKENPTEEEIKERDEFFEECRMNPMIKFMIKAFELDEFYNRVDLKINEEPYRDEDTKLWQSLPYVKGPDGRPMPRKAIRDDEDADDKFWDFTKQFFFGLWGYRQRPYPPQKPIDFAQAFGYKRLEKRYYDFIMRSGGFYYKDRLGRTRGPLELITLKTAWGAGIIDKDTFIWGEDMDEWAPIHMVYGLEKAIATWDVRLGAAATAAYHKLAKGIPPWVPLKNEPKNYKELQKEAMESKRRDLAVLEANGGTWPGVRIPSHALFLWASGSELTTILEADHMPNKYIPKDLRIELAKAIPGLRPWEVLSIEQAMDQIAYGGKWYREKLGFATTGHPYVKRLLPEVKTLVEGAEKLSRAANYALEEVLPGCTSKLENYFSKWMEIERKKRWNRFGKR